MKKVLVLGALAVSMATVMAGWYISRSAQAQEKEQLISPAQCRCSPMGETIGTPTNGQIYHCVCGAVSCGVVPKLNAISCGNR